jgi:hypothetical protein
MGNQWAECCDTWLQNKDRRFARRFGICSFILMTLLDLASVILLREAPTILVPPGSNVSESETEFAWWVERTDEDYSVDWSWDYLVKHLGDYKHDVVDVLLMFIIRIVVTVLLVRIAIAVGRPDLHGINTAATSTQPLLINAGEGQVRTACLLFFFLFFIEHQLRWLPPACRARSCTSSPRRRTKAISSLTTARSAPRFARTSRSASFLSSAQSRRYISALK